MYNKLLEKIEAYDKIIIHGHKRPDGDCYGSQLGLKGIIKASFPSKLVYVVGERCEYVSFLGEMDEITDDMYENALVIVVDTAVSDRISDQRYSKASYVIKVDHHLPVDDYGDMQLVDTTLPACALIIAEFMHKCDLNITLEGAKALYTGIVTDTGRFRLPGVNSRVFALAGLLLDKGVNVEEIDNNLSVETLNTIKLKGYVLLNFQITENGFAYINMTRDVIEQFGVSDEEASSMVSLLGTLETCPSWGLIMEYPGNEIRIRLRSRGPYVDKLANKYNGGGHLKASGASLPSFDALDDFLKDADKLVKEYKENGTLEFSE